MKEIKNTTYKYICILYEIVVYLYLCTNIKKAMNK